MKLKLHESIVSPQDLKALVLEVKQYASWWLHNDVKRRRSAKGETEPPVFSEATTSLLKLWAGDKPLTQAKLDELVIVLQDFAEAAPTLNITLAAPPTNGLKKELSSGCRHNIDQSVLVSFDFN